MGTLWTRISEYERHVRTSFAHAVLTTLRHKRILFAGAVTLTPVMLPVALAFLTTGPTADGKEVFIPLVEHFFLKALAPLLALFFGAMLVGQSVESQTIPFILTRPVPRSAWIVGKYLAYVVVTSVLLLTSFALVYFACGALGGLRDARGMGLAWHYAGMLVVALMAYGSLCTLLGALFKRPVVVGVIFFFGWQRLATIVPGLVDFLTIEKYVMALLPELDTPRRSLALKASALTKQEILVSETRALMTLGLLILVFLALTSYVVRRKEYSSAKAVEG